MIRDLRAKKPTTLLDAQKVTAVVAKRHASNAYDRVLERYMEIMEEEHLQFIRDLSEE